MKVSFELTMPNVGSWNGRWTGEGKKYYVIRTYKTKVQQSRVLELLQGKESRYWHYNFGDGWAAGVTMQVVDAKEAKKREKISAGFSSYQWMIDSIIQCGVILSRPPAPTLIY